MEPHKDMNGNILRLGDYVVKEGNELVEFEYRGSNNEDDLRERTPFSGRVTHIHSSMSRELNINNEVVQSSGGDKVGYIIISVLRPLRLQNYRVVHSHYIDDNPDMKLRWVNRQEAERAVFRDGSGQVSGEGRRISRTGASTGQSTGERGGRRNQRKKRTKKKSRRRKRRTKKRRKKKTRKKRGGLTTPADKNNLEPGKIYFYKRPGSRWIFKGTYSGPVNGNLQFDNWSGSEKQGTNFGRLGPFPSFTEDISHIDKIWRFNPRGVQEAHVLPDFLSERISRFVGGKRRRKKKRKTRR